MLKPVCIECHVQFVKFGAVAARRCYFTLTATAPCLTSFEYCVNVVKISDLNPSAKNFQKTTAKCIDRNGKTGAKLGKCTEPGGNRYCIFSSGSDFHCNGSSVKGNRSVLGVNPADFYIGPFKQN